MSPKGERLTGQAIAGYRLLHVLGAGGMSEVYLAQRIEDPTALIALKVLLPSWRLPPETRANFHARFLREARAAQRLRHPHILPVLSYGEEGDVTYMVLPFMPGGTLADRLLKSPHGVPLTEAGTYLAQLADALDFAHAQGVVHRDLKPTNVLMDDHDQLFLADLGIARLVDPADGTTRPAGSQPLATLTMTGQVLGTPVYMAPEQLASGRVGPAADIYALGIVLYQMVTGAVPFQAETPIGLAMQHAHEPPPPPRTSRPDLPAPAEAAILRALAKSPDARFASAGALTRAYLAGLRDEWTEGLAPASAPELPSMPPTMVATPTPQTIAATPARYPTGSMPYLPPMSFPPPIPRRSRAVPALLAALALVALLAAAGVSAFGSGLLRFGGGTTPSPSAGQAANTPNTRPTVTPTATGSLSACLSIPGFSGHAGPASAGAGFPDVPFPAHSVSYLSQQFHDGNYAFQLYSACTASSTHDAIQAFYAAELPANGWSPSTTYPYAGDPTRACGDTYCWIKGSSPARYASLEEVRANGSATVYQLRLGYLP